MMIYLLEHLNDFWPALVICLFSGLLLVQVPRVRRLINDFAPDAISRALVGLFVGAVCFVGWAKGPVSTGRTVAQFITALHSGIIDRSGLVASTSQTETVSAFAKLANAIIYSASNVIDQAQGEIDAVAALITNETRKVVYLAADLPRAEPTQHTNHNIAATVERVRQSADGSTLSMWCWYSQEPVIAPDVGAEIDVGAGWVKLEAITNYYPAVEDINGVPCVQYDFGVPELARHVVFRPQYELGFGHSDAPLLVPSGGITVTTNDVTRLPFNGIDTYCGGRAEVVYHGGIATELRIDGIAVTNGVYEL